MAETLDNSAETRDPLRLERCPECGYLLTGLPESGICPECGFGYNPDMIVLYGWAQHMRANDANRRRGRLSWGMFWFVRALVLLWMVALVLTGGWFAALIPVLILLLAARSLYRRRTLLADAPAPVQLRLSPEGFAQRDGVGPVTLRPWGRRRRLWLIKRWRPNRYHIRSWRSGLLVLFRWRHVDFEFECDPVTAERIRQRINEWSAASSPSGRATAGSKAFPAHGSAR